MVSLSASGGGYANTTATVSVSVTDDDTANLVVRTSSLTVGQAGSGTFTVKLATQPSANVTGGLLRRHGSGDGIPREPDLHDELGHHADGDGERCGRLGHRRRERHGVAERVGRRLRQHDGHGERQRHGRRHGEPGGQRLLADRGRGGQRHLHGEAGHAAQRERDVGVSSDDTGAATASPASLTFTTATGTPRRR